MEWRRGHAAVAVLSFDVDAEAPILAAGRRYAERAMVMTYQAYGPLVGVPRILALLAEYDLKATFFVPGVTASPRLLYDSSLTDDDRPYALETDAGTIVELPPHWRLDDWEQYAYLPDLPIGTAIEAPAKVLDLWTNELDAMRRYGCLFVLTCHPFLSGRPGRVETLRRVIEHALERGDVEVATGAQVAARVLDDPGTTARRLRPLEVDEAVYPKV